MQNEKLKVDLKRCKEKYKILNKKYIDLEDIDKERRKTIVSQSSELIQLRERDERLAEENRILKINIINLEKEIKRMKFNITTAFPNSFSKEIGDGKPTY